MYCPRFLGALLWCCLAFPFFPTLQAQPALQVASLNMAKETETPKILADLAKAPRVRDADVLLLQEVLDTGVVRELAKALGRYSAFAPAFVVRAGVWEGLAVLSRYPMRDREVVRLKANRLHFKTRSRIALGYTIESPLGPVRIYNLHLDNRINDRDKRAQASEVIERANRYPGPVLIGGDFNTGDFLWVSHVLPLPYLQRQSETVAREMEASGFSTPFASTPATFDLFGLKLDWIYAKRLSAHAQDVVPIGFSDHRAIWAKFEAENQGYAAAP